MTDESKVKTTFIRPVNRTMSYEDRRGYVCMYVCISLHHFYNIFIIFDAVVGHKRNIKHEK